MNLGMLIIGEDAVSFEINKSWADEPEGFDRRPDFQTFLNGLRIFNGKDEYQLGSILFVEKFNNEDGKEVSWYYADEDPSVTFAVVEEDPSAWKITVEGLPAEINGIPAQYQIDEMVNGYRTTISGDMQNGFDIINTWSPAPLPTPTPDVQKLDFFRLLESAGQLPQTGISE